MRGTLVDIDVDMPLTALSMQSDRCRMYNFDNAMDSLPLVVHPRRLNQVSHSALHSCGAVTHTSDGVSQFAEAGPAHAQDFEINTVTRVGGARNILRPRGLIN
jgi:hypothetical protein